MSNMDNLGIQDEIAHKLIDQLPISSQPLHFDNFSQVIQKFEEKKVQVKTLNFDALKRTQTLDRMTSLKNTPHFLESVNQK